MKQFMQIAFLIIATITVLEFIFIQGLFTWLIVVSLSLVFGAINIILSLKDKEWIMVWIYALLTISLTMGYFEIAF